MFSSEKKTLEFLSQLAIKLTASAHQLGEATRRLQLTELTYREYLMRLRRLDEQMKTLLDLLQAPVKTEPPAEETNPAFCEPPPPPPPPPTRKKLRYSDYIEFSNYAELKKFEKMGEITEDELNHLDADELMRRLLESEEPQPPDA